MLGQNGTGKTTFIKMLAGVLKPDNEDVEMMKLSISYKPQTISPKFKGTVCLLYTSPSPRDKRQSRMPSSA